MTFFLLSNFQKFLKFSSILVPVPFCKLVRIWTLLLSIYIDSKDLQSNFEVPAVFGSTYFWVSLYKLPTVVFGSSLWREQTIKKWKAKISTTYIAKVLRTISSFNRIYDIATISWFLFFFLKLLILKLVCVTDVKILSDPRKNCPKLFLVWTSDICSNSLEILFSLFWGKWQYDKYRVLGKRMYVVCWYWQDIKNEKNVRGKMHFLTFLPHHFVIFTVLLLSENLCVEQFWVNMVIELMYLHICLISIWELLLSDLACPHVGLNIYLRCL